MRFRDSRNCRLSSVPIFPIFSYFFRFPIFFLYFNPISYIFYQIPIFFKMLQIKCIDVQYRALFSKTVNLWCKFKNPVTLHYDETTTTQVIKQVDLHFRFWSEEQNEVVRRFYTALMFGHAEGAKVAAAMVDKLEEDKVNLSSIITLSSNVPN